MMDSLHRPTKIKADLSKFFVITCISNPVRYRRRYELYWRFKDMCDEAGVKLITVEQAFGHRPWILTEKGNPYHLQVRTVEELWHKENMINLGIKHATATFGHDAVREVAWIDADCRAARPAKEWFADTWHALQHYEIVQMWEWLLSLDHSDNGIGRPGPSFMANYVKYGTPYPKGIIKNPYGEPTALQWGSPGLAWAANVDALNKIGCGLTGPLNDWSVLGAGDWYFAHAMVSDDLLPDLSRYSQGYQKKFKRMVDLSQRWLKRDVGYVPGLVLDDWHGKKVNRGYNTREQILIKYNFDPNEDLKVDHQGLLQLETDSHRQIHLRDHIRRYFRARHEDDISL
jgi:hypothetical protein